MSTKLDTQDFWRAFVMSFTIIGGATIFLYWGVRGC